MQECLARQIFPQLSVSYLLVVDDLEVASAHGGIRELHEVCPLQHGGLLAPPDAPALRDAKRLLVPVGIGRTQALAAKPREKKAEKER